MHRTYDSHLSVTYSIKTCQTIADSIQRDETWTLALRRRNWTRQGPDSWKDRKLSCWLLPTISSYIATSLFEIWLFTLHPVRQACGRLQQIQQVVSEVKICTPLKWSHYAVHDSVARICSAQTTLSNVNALSLAILCTAGCGLYRNIIWHGETDHVSGHCVQVAIFTELQGETNNPVKAFRLHHLKRSTEAARQSILVRVSTFLRKEYGEARCLTFVHMEKNRYQVYKIFDGMICDCRRVVF